MTPEELRDRLRRMTNEENDKFKRAINRYGQNDDQLIDQFIDIPAVEKRLCQYFGVPTLAEKMAHDTYAVSKRNFYVGIATLAVTALGLVASVAAC